MSRVKKQKAIKTVSPKELKAWLRGIQEFQPAGWTPSTEQWDAIRERIFLLDETEYAEAFVDAYDNRQHVYTQPHTPAYTPVKVEPSIAYSSLPPSDSSLSEPNNRPMDSGHVAIAKSPTESGMVSLSSQSIVLEGDYKTPF
jgi:hypothetical protein